MSVIEIPKAAVIESERNSIGELRMAVIYPLVHEDARATGQAFLADLVAHGFNTQEGKVTRSAEALQSLASGQVREFACEMFRHSDVVHVILPSEKELQNGELWFTQMLLGLHDAKMLMPLYRKFVVPVRLTKDSLPAMFANDTPIDIFDGRTGASELLGAWNIVAVQKSAVEK